MEKKDEAKDLVRKVIDEGLVERNIGGSIMVDEDEIQISKSKNDSVRFDLPQKEKAFVLMSGRLYEREYALDLSGPEFDEDEAEESTGFSLVPPRPDPGSEPEDEEDNEPLREEGGVESEASEAQTVQQLDYKGNIEEVDPKTFKNRIECGCGNVRWVKNADLFQVKKCKPCTYRDRLNRRKK